MSRVLHTQTFRRSTLWVEWDLGAWALGVHRVGRDWNIYAGPLLITWLR